MAYNLYMGRFVSAFLLLLLLGCSGAVNPVPPAEVGTIRAVTIIGSDASLIIRLRSRGEWTMEAEGGRVSLNPGDIYSLQPGGEFRLPVDIREIIYSDYLIFNDRWLSPAGRQNLLLWYESERDSWLTVKL